MRYILFATAGHVDHGKTSLIKALTGIDTDRLPEEKKRGLSIDIGFAYLDFPEISTRLEIIDVPGHERFIKNAIAGLASAVGVMLVVDPAEGVMPQTVEHLRVARSFGIDRGVAVLTKIDKVDEEILEIAREELRDFLRSEGVNMPIVAVSSLTGEGLDDLKETLKEVVRDFKTEKASRPLRVLVDSAFSVKGYGTVLRGSCVEGRVKEGDRVIVEPLGVETRVRKIQNHGEFVREATAGERVALNLPEVQREKVERGFWILKPGSYVKGKRLLLRSDLDLKPGKIYTLFFGMREVRGRLRHVEEDVYLLGLFEETVSRRGDRVVILDSSGTLVGGAEVLHPRVRITRKSFVRENLRELLNSFETYLLKEFGSDGLEGSHFRRLTGSPPDVKRLERDAVKVGDRFYHREIVERLKGKLQSFLEKELKEKVFGIPKAEVIESLGLPADLFEHLIKGLRGFTVIEELVVREGGGDIREHPQVKKLLQLLSEGFKEERELIASGISGEILSLAVRRRLVHRIGDYLFLSDDQLKRFLKELRDLGEEFSLQDAKKKLGLTRKYLIPLLEYMDLMGFTLREGAKRRWRSAQRYRP